MFKLIFKEQAKEDLLELQSDPTLLKRLKAVRKALGHLQLNPRHTGLNTHKYKSKTTDSGDDIFEAYAENNTPGAYRIFWHYGPGKKIITIITIIPHP